MTPNEQLQFALGQVETTFALVEQERDEALSLLREWREWTSGKDGRTLTLMEGVRYLGELAQRVDALLAVYDQRAEAAIPVASGEDADMEVPF